MRCAVCGSTARLGIVVKFICTNPPCSSYTNDGTTWITGVHWKMWKIEED